MTAYGKRWSDQEILESFWRWAAEHEGEPPKWQDWVKTDGEYPTPQTICQRCGSWTDGLIIAGFEPRVNPRTPKFDRNEARRLREQGLSDFVIAVTLGVGASSIGKALGPKPKPPRKPRNAAEAREARIAALRKALEKQKS